jgi:hypothetical protein
MQTGRKILFSSLSSYSTIFLCLLKLTAFRCESVTKEKKRKREREREREREKEKEKEKEYVLKKQNKLIILDIQLS